MPLSEFIQATRAKFDSNQSTMTSPIPDLPSSLPGGDFLELLLENGQIVMQGQASRPRKNSIPNFSPPLPTRLHEKEGREVVPSRIGRFNAIDSLGNNSLVTEVSGQIGPNTQDDDMVPWLNYPIDDYCLEFLTEFPGNNTSSLPSQVIPTDKGGNSSSQVIRDSSSIDYNTSMKALTGGPDPVRTRNSQFTQIPQQWFSSFSASKSRTPDFAATNNTGVGQNPPLDLPNTRLKGQDAASSPKLPRPASSAGLGLVNFSHFSRPAAHVKTSLQNVDRLKRNEKASIGTSSYAVESTLIDSSCDLKSVSQGLLVPVTTKCEAKAKIPTQPQQELASVVHSEAVNWEDVSRDMTVASNKSKRLSDHLPDKGSTFRMKVSDSGQESEKCSEPVVASSSVCSGNGTDVASSDPKNRTKRKMPEGEEFSYQSEDLDEESTGVRKPTASRGSTAKRSRAAEVHNLSERRRRDRINEKMRALQELIPNCNKVDKASMLDEAIEYLKALQFQVQIMSMGSGLCIPPMMLPQGMQHLHPHPVAHFSPMSVGMGMGMGMGFGMGMLDMNGSPMIPVPPMPGTQFPCSSIPGNPAMLGVPMFGIPGQSHPVPMTHGSPYPLQVHSARMNFVPKVSGTMGTPINPVELAYSGSLKDQKIEKNLETEFKAEADDSHLPSCTQATKECLKESSTKQIKKNASHSSDGTINSTTGNGNSSTGTSCSVD